MAYVERDANTTAAHHVDVQAELERLVTQAARKAEIKLARHRDVAPHHRIGTDKGHIDHYLYMEGPGAGPLELGHDVVDDDGQVVGYAEGLFIISDAIGLPRRGA